MNLLNGDCMDVLKTLEAESVDSLVTDPPAGISFMGKAWDSDKGGRDEWIKWLSQVMSECLRVMKPGAHGLIWAIPRTSHWTATALEDAGFEIRDVVTHLFGSGFPKSLDISKAIDKAAGVAVTTDYIPQARNEVFGRGKGKAAGVDRTPGAKLSCKPATPAAQRWQGFGTALKPASEHWILVRKPLSEKTVAANVLKHGVGGLNIDASRIGTADSGLNRLSRANKKATADSQVMPTKVESISQTLQGRFPANLVFSHTPHCTDSQCDIECAIAMLDRQSGHLHGNGTTRNGKSSLFGSGAGESAQRTGDKQGGGASRFFYCAKVSASERNAGLDGVEAKEVATSTGQTRPNKPARLGSNPDGVQVAKNHHPTVKPQKLMSYLCRMVTPPGGIVLDPFMGSGSTGLAAKSEGFGFIGIEREAEYHKIAETRIFNHFPKYEKKVKR